MRWYLNDVSLQGQYNAAADFLDVLSELLSARSRFAVLKVSLYITRSLAGREVGAGQSLRDFLSRTDRRDLRSAMLFWLDRTGPFVDDDRHPEVDDYFECMNLDVTDTGLGEAARRVKVSQAAIAFSFSGGPNNFAVSPLVVNHGLADERLGTYGIENLWSVGRLSASVLDRQPEPVTWEQLVCNARARFPHLIIPDTIYRNRKLAREPFDGPIRDRTMTLLSHLNAYMQGRNEDGSEGDDARAILENFFTGDRALFSGESPSNQRSFVTELTFPDPSDPNRTIFGHWHGKISHRSFRLHFEWPVPVAVTQLKILYLGPKLTKI